jgi:hypothetical protein
MAETKKRSDLIQEQIDRLMKTAPSPYTADEIKQIEKGRKGQKEIDEGRATVNKRAEEVRAFNAQIERLNEQLGKAIESEANLARQSSADKSAEAKEAEKRSPYGVGIQIASGLPAAAAGYATGRSIGSKINAEADKSQASKNATLSQAAQDRVAGLTTREGARTGMQRAGAMPPASSVGRFISRAGPQATIGGLMAGKGLLLAKNVDENDPLLNQGINQGFASGLIGAGVGMAEKGLQYGFNPGVAPDARAIAIMESNQLRRGGLNNAVDRGSLNTPQTALPPPNEPDVTPKAAPTPGSVAHLREQAKALGVKGTSRMGKGELASALQKAIGDQAGKRARGPRIPKGGGAAGIAAGLAYAATPDQAQAADGSQGNNQARGLANAAVAGGAAYGASRLADKMGPVGRTVVGGMGEAMTPLAIDAMTDYSPDELAQGRNYLARTLPAWARGGAVEDAYQMATVPEPNPMRGQQGANDFEAVLGEVIEALSAYQQ